MSVVGDDGTEYVKLTGQNSPQWQLHSSVTGSTGGGRRLGLPVLDSPHVGQNLKSPGHVLSPSVSRSREEQCLHVQSPVGAAVGAAFLPTDAESIAEVDISLMSNASF